jgi:hypothetical protein
VVVVVIGAISVVVIAGTDVVTAELGEEEAANRERPVRDDRPVHAQELVRHHEPERSPDHGARDGVVAAVVVLRRRRRTMPHGGQHVEAGPDCDHRGPLDLFPTAATLPGRPELNALEDGPVQAPEPAAAASSALSLDAARTAAVGLEGIVDDAGIATTTTTTPHGFSLSS